MISGWLVACRFEVVFTFLRCEGVEEAGEGGGDGLGGARSFFAQQMLELGEELLDGVEVGRVFRQEEELGPGGSDGLTYGFAPVASEVGHHDDLIWLERGGENLLDIGPEALAVDRAIYEPGRVDAVMAQSGQKRHRLPAAMRDLDPPPLAPRRPSSERRHVGPGPGLIDEDQALRRDPALILPPLLASARDVGAIPFAGDHGSSASQRGRSSRPTGNRPSAHARRARPQARVW